METTLYQPSGHNQHPSWEITQYAHHFGYDFDRVMDDFNSMQMPPEVANAPYYMRPFKMLQYQDRQKRNTRNGSGTGQGQGCGCTACGSTKKKTSFLEFPEEVKNIYFILSFILLILSLINLFKK